MKQRDRDTRERLLRVGRAAVRRARLQERHRPRHLPCGARQRRGGQLPLRRQARAVSRSAAARHRHDARDQRRGARAGEGQPPRSGCGATSTSHCPARWRKAPRGLDSRLIKREMADPTPAFDTLVEQVIRPAARRPVGDRRRAARLRRRATSACVRCVASIHAQWIAVRAESAAPRGCGRSFSCAATAPTALAEHIAGFLARRDPGGGDRPLRLEWKRSVCLAVDRRSFCVRPEDPDRPRFALRRCSNTSTGSARA